MKKIYEDFFLELLNNTDELSTYVDSLYKCSEYSEDDLNSIFGVLKSEGLIACSYADNRAWVYEITFEGKHYFDNESGSDTPVLIELIDRIDELELAFHSVGNETSGLQVEEIYDTSEFQEWIQEVQFEIQNLMELVDDDFLKGVYTLVTKRFNGWNDRKDFTEIKGKLMVIKKNYDKYFSQEKGMEREVMQVERKPLIFISHSSKNKEQVSLLVELLRSINLQPQQDIFCSSLPGYDIPIGADIFEFLRDRFLNYDLHVIFIHSSDYYESAVSLNEMGAAWALKKESTSFLLPEFPFEEMKGVINDRNISIKLDNDISEVKDKLNQLRKKLENEFSLTTIPDITWEEARDKFIQAVNIQGKQIKQVDPDVVILLKKVASSSDGIILTPSDLSDGMSIQIGDEVIASELPDRREFVRWKAALMKSLENGYIEVKSDEVYAITQDGYLYVE